MIEKINNIMDKVAVLKSDLESPSQNPAYGTPTKDDIIDVLGEVLSIHSHLERMYEDSQKFDEERDDMSRTFGNVEDYINDAVRYLDYAIREIQYR